jgi:phosphatidylinositol alpha-mannosyltransferase
MKIGMVSEFYYPHPGGISEHVRCVSRELVRLGHEVVVVTGRMKEGVVEPGPRTIRLGRSVPVRYNAGLSRVTVGWRLRSDLAAVLREERFDLVHVHNPLMPALPLLALELAECPVVATLHSGYPRDRLTEVFRRPLQARLSRARCLLPVSRAAHRTVVPHFTGDFRIVPNGVDYDFFAAAGRGRDASAGDRARPRGATIEIEPRRRRRLLFVGALVPRKGLPVLLRAFDLLAKRDGDLDLWVAGDGPARDAAKRGVPRRLRDRVRFLGHCDRGRLRDCFAEADLFCAPSLGRESFGMVLLEAMAAGVPVVASDIDGYREVVAHGIDGLLVPSGDAGALAGAAALALGDEELCARLVRAGRSKAAALRWSRVASRHAAIYRDATGDAETGISFEGPDLAEAVGTGLTLPSSDSRRYDRPRRGR